MIFLLLYLWIREQILLPVNFEYMLQILFTLRFIGGRYLVYTLYIIQEGATLAVEESISIQ